MDLLTVEPMALQPHNVQSCEVGAITQSHSKGNHVVFDATHPANEGVRPYAHKLMDGGKSAEDGMILHGYMAGKRRIIREDYVIAHLAIVRNMGCGEKKAMSANASDVASAPSPSVHSHMLPDGSERTDDELTFLAAVFFVLRWSPKNSKWMDFGAFSNLRLPSDDRVRVDPYAIAKANMPAYHCERTDLDALAKFSAGVNRGPEDGFYEPPCVGSLGVAGFTRLVARIYNHRAYLGLRH